MDEFLGLRPLIYIEKQTHFLAGRVVQTRWPTLMTTPQELRSATGFMHWLGFLFLTKAVGAITKQDYYLHKVIFCI